MLNNLPTPDAIADDPRVLTALPLDALQAILDGIAERTTLLANAKKAINGHIAERLNADITAAYLAKGEDTGSVHVFRDGMDVKVDRPKKVTWDQAKLAEAAASIQAGGDDVSEYVDVTYSVPEAKYKAWPGMIRRVFEAARTVTPGNPAITLTAAQAEAA